MKLNTLQAGRGLAALAVVLHHAATATTAFVGPFPFSGIFEFGYLGVDFFFVLSGFIIFYTTDPARKSFSEYSIQRLRRVFVPYLPIGIGMALLYIFLPNISQGGPKDWSWLTSLTLSPVGDPPALSVAWTLRHEIFFYLLFGLAIYSKQARIVLGLWALALIANHFYEFSDAIPLNRINLEFFFGMAAARFRRYACHYLLLLAALSFLSWYFTGCQRSYSLLVGLGLALVIPALTQLENSGRLRVPRPLIFLGDASYSVYLLHSLAISVVARVVSGSGVIGFFLISGSGLVAGLAYYFLVERPGLTLFKGRKPLTIGA